jgi:hypothetical protein
MFSRLMIFAAALLPGDVPADIRQPHIMFELNHPQIECGPTWFKPEERFLSYPPLALRELKVECKNFSVEAFVDRDLTSLETSFFVALPRIAYLKNEPLMRGEWHMFDKVRLNLGEKTEIKAGHWSMALTSNR